jgi:hypothetical protein
MKTIIVIYTNKKITNKQELSRTKKYSFNTESNLNVGDLLDSPTYDTKMQVVKILTKSHKYFNSATGKLSNAYSSTSQWEVRTMVIRESEEDVVYASIIPEN